MKAFFLILIISTLVLYTGKSQNNPQDCKDAKPICTTLDSTNVSYMGYGKIKEINGEFSCIHDGEKNSVWYVINVQSDGLLGFLIKPKVETDDYDWAVYNITKNDCSEIFSNPVLEVSCNYSQASQYYLQFKGKTGPTGDSSGSRRDKMDGPFNDRIPAKKGETYVIMVSNYQTDAKDGYTIDFSYSTAQIYDNQPPQMTGANAMFCNDTTIIIRFSENVICSSVDPGDFLVSGQGGPYNVKSVYSESCLSGGFYDREFKVVIDKPMPFPNMQYKIDLVGEVSDVCGNYTDVDQRFGFQFSKLYVNLVAPSDTVCYNTPFQLNAVYNGTEPVTYTWTQANLLSCTDCTNPMATITQRTTFKIVMEDANGCKGQDSITLYVRQLPDLLVAQSNYKICENDTINLSATTASKNIVFKWKPATGLNRDDIPNPLAFPVETTKYTVTATDTLTGCIKTAEVLVEVFSAVNPEITVNGKSGSVTVCSNEENLIDAGEKDPASGDTYIQYIWYFNNTKLPDSGRFLKITNSGRYVAEIFNQADCVGRDTIDISFYQLPELALYYKDTICLGEVLKLRADVVKSEGALEFRWFDFESPLPNSNTAFIETTPAGVGNYRYSVAAKDLTNGCTSYDTLFVEVMKEMTFPLDSAAFVCNGRELRIEIRPLGGTPEYSYTWVPENGITFPDPTDKSVALIKTEINTKYTVTLEDAVGCLTEKSIMVYNITPKCKIVPDNIVFSSTDREVDLPVRALECQGLFECTPNSAKVSMSVDLPIFNPQYVICGGKRIEIIKTADNSNRKWNLRFVIPGESLEKESNALYTLVGDMILGDMESGKATVTDVEWEGLTVNTAFEEGIISLGNVCNDGSQRLIRYDALFGIVSIIPNPAGSESEVTLDAPPDGYIRSIAITDMIGRTVYSENWQGRKSNEITADRKTITINTTNIKSGLYRISYCTGAYCESSELMIIH